MVRQEDTRELVVHDRHANGYVVCLDVIDEPVVCQEDTYELVVHDRHGTDMLSVRMLSKNLWFVKKIPVSL